MTETCGMLCMSESNGQRFMLSWRIFSSDKWNPMPHESWTALWSESRITYTQKYIFLWHSMKIPLLNLYVASYLATVVKSNNGRACFPYSYFIIIFVSHICIIYCYKCKCRECYIYHVMLNMGHVVFSKIQVQEYILFFFLCRIIFLWEVG